MKTLIVIGGGPAGITAALEAAGIDWTAQGVTVDAFGRTSVPHIFAAGDVTGAPCIANRGQAQARVAVRQALDQPTPPFRPETIIEAVYTSPQLAQVGSTRRRRFLRDGLSRSIGPTSAPPSSRAWPIARRVL